MDKAPNAFRTISEVADDLDIPQHVLRFWETRFTQIKPMKRSGGRRYYRPDDVDLLRGIRRLLYGEGYTIRGVQRILREQGIKAVQGLADSAAVPPSAVTERQRVAPEDDESELSAPELDDIDDDEQGADDEAGFDEGEEEDNDEEPSPSIVQPDRDRGATRPPANPFQGTSRPEPVFAPPRPGGEPAARAEEGISRSDAKRLRAALDDLVACKRLIDDALKGAPVEMFPLK